MELIYTRRINTKERLPRRKESLQTYANRIDRSMKWCRMFVGLFHFSRFNFVFRAGSKGRAEGGGGGEVEKPSGMDHNKSVSISCRTKTGNQYLSLCHAIQAMLSRRVCGCINSSILINWMLSVFAPSSPQARLRCFIECLV